VIDRGNLRAEKVAYPEQTWCCIWTPFDGHEDLCFDIKEEDLDDLIALLVELREMPPELADDE
jgi:hypothetical protein